jgi:hypothetical protein
VAAYIKRTALHGNPKPKRKNAGRMKSLWKKLKRRADGTFIAARYSKHAKKKSTRPHSVSTRRTQQSGATRNPTRLLLEFAAPVVNPRKNRKNSMAKHSAKHRARTATGQFKKTKHRKSKTHNPVAKTRTVYKTRYRKSKPKTHYRTRKVEVVKYRNKSRNPEFFGGQARMTDIAVAIAGTLLGVTATKVGVSYIPTTVITSNLGKVLASLAVALAAGFLAKKAVPKGFFGDAVLLAGLAQTGSVMLNAFIPSVGQYFGLGMGEFVNATYSVPENPFQRLQMANAMAQSAQAQIAASGGGKTMPAVAAGGVAGFGRAPFSGSRGGFFGR